MQRNPPTLTGSRFLLLLFVWLLFLSGPAAAKDDRVEALAPKYQEWLKKVELLISKEEKNLFLELEEDYQRDAFIDRFWKVRDPYGRTGRNEFREQWEARLRTVDELFGGEYDDRTTIFLLNGPPLERLELDCSPYLWPTEVWYYDGSETVGFEFLLLFYRRWGAQTYRLWEPFAGLDDLGQQRGISLGSIERECGLKADAILAAISFLLSQGSIVGATSMLDRLMQKPEPPNKEWVASFSTYSTELPEDVGTFEARLEIDYPGRHQNRTVLQGALVVETSQLELSQLGGHGSYNLMLNGEVLRGNELFENFRYKYDFPQGEIPDDAVPLIFQRYLRPGEYTLIVKAEDLNAGAFHRQEVDVTVPRLEKAMPTEPADPETARILAEANAAIRSGESTLKIAPLLGEWQTGMVRINTLMTGDDIDKVTFFLDDQPILTKKRPPYDVELDLGAVPRARVLRVEGYDADDEVVASDETMINAGRHRFAVRLEEPRRGQRYVSSLRAQADVVLPEGEIVERVEFFLNETLVATVYQPPYIQPIVLPDGEAIAYVRAVAYTPDGNSAEDLVFINAPDNLEEIDVDFVELYTTVLDKDQRPVEGLTEADFTVYEDGVQQQLVRFEVVRNLPIHVAILLDVSASMEEEIGQAQTAALHFFEQAVTPKDRATVITFNDHPNLLTPFTNEIPRLSGALAGLKAERGTALYDSVIYTLYYFNGIKGQRAILILSDGKDESSRFEFDDALEYAHRSGVAIYAIGLKLGKKDLDVRRKLTKLADETGGRSFFVDTETELTTIYDAIQRELRSRYLLAYQSSNTSGDKRFRTIEVNLSRPGLEAKTLRGYYP